jgi:hypothetical protein
MVCSGMLGKGGKEDERRVDIVLGDSGFELFADIMLACFLLSAGLATNVVLRSKVQLCHLSVIHGDISCLFNAGKMPSTLRQMTLEPLSEREIGGDVEFLFSQWRQFYDEGKLITGARLMGAQSMKL